MISTYLVAVLWFPLSLLGISVGLGLLTRRISRDAFGPILVIPVGLAGAYVITNFLEGWSATAPLAGPLTAVVAALGLVLGRDELERAWAHVRQTGLREQHWIWPALAALAAFVAVASPEIFAGQPTWSGVEHNIDIGHQFSLGAWLAAHGREIPPTYISTPAHSSFVEAVGKFVGSGYPGGGQGLIGSLSVLLGTDQTWLWQTFMAFIAAAGALAAYSLASLVIAPRPLRALAAGTVIQANILFGYALEGGVKELSAATFLLLAAALLASGPSAIRVGRKPIALAIVVAAGFAAFNVTILPWLAVLLAGVFATGILQVAWSLRLRDQPSAAGARLKRLSDLPSMAWPTIRTTAFRRGLGVYVLGWFEVLAITAALSIPTIQAALKLAPGAAGFQPGGPQSALGNLAGPVPTWSAAGPWITGDPRFGLTSHETITYDAIYLVIALIVIGVCWALVRRSAAIVWLAAAGGIALAYITGRYDPWIIFKAESVTGPISLLLAFIGAGAIFSISRLGRLRWIGPLAALAVGGAVLWGNALDYHDTTLAPYGRMHDLEIIGERFAGPGLTLAPSWDEYAEYYLRNMQAIAYPDTTSFIAYRVGNTIPPGPLWDADISQFDARYLEHFRYLVLRRGPLATRPPSDFRLVMQTHYYDVWEQARTPWRILDHIPITTATQRSVSFCSAVKRRALATGGTEIAYVTTPVLGAIFPLQFSHSPNFVPVGNAFFGYGAGKATIKIKLPRTGRWTFWLGGSSERPVETLVDGQAYGTVAYQANYPSQWMLVGTHVLHSGIHSIEILRGGGSLHPASGSDQGSSTNITFGPLVTALGRARQDQPVRRIPLSALPNACRTTDGWDWIEILRPRGTVPVAYRR